MHHNTYNLEYFISKSIQKRPKIINMCFIPSCNLLHEKINIHIKHNLYTFSWSLTLNAIGQCMRYKSKYFNPRSSRDFFKLSRTMSGSWQVFHNYKTENKHHKELIFAQNCVPLILYRGFPSIAGAVHWCLSLKKNF